MQVFPLCRSFLYTGHSSMQVFPLRRSFLYAGLSSTQVFPLRRSFLYAGLSSTQVFPLHRSFLYVGLSSTQVFPLRGYYYLLLFINYLILKSGSSLPAVALLFTKKLYFHLLTKTFYWYSVSAGVWPSSGTSKVKKSEVSEEVIRKRRQEGCM